MSNNDIETISKIDEIRYELSELGNLLKSKPKLGLQEFDIVSSKENYDEIVSQLNSVLLKLKTGLERNYTLPFPSLPDTLHWEIVNEFKDYFLKNNKVKSLIPETPCGFRSKNRADLCIETSDGKLYWIEVQTTLKSDEIEKKLLDARHISNNDRYAEYVLIFPREFQEDSLFDTTKLQAKGNVKTNKLRIMLYSGRKFETVLEPTERHPDDISVFFGDSL